MERKDLGRFVSKLLIVAAPFILAILLESLVLPIDSFCFRVWEALQTRNELLLSGPFYPNQHIAKTEEGDLGHHTPRAVKKQVEWWTDRFGYRKRETGQHGYRIVIVGDSNIAGSGLTQDDMLSEVLERRLKLGVYPLAPGDVNSFLRDERFRVEPPKIVIVESIERSLLSLPEPLLRVKTDNKSTGILGFLRYNPTAQRFMVVISRVLRSNILNYLRARILDSLNQVILALAGEPKAVRTGSSMLFFQGDSANADIPDLEIEKIVRTLVTYRDLLARKGIRFIFLPVPNKENIYYSQLPSRKPATLLRKLIKALTEQNVEVIDTQSAFDQALDHGVLLYHVDDTHWNSQGVRIAADLICDRLAARHD
jgi:hypothetical protein